MHPQMLIHTYRYSPFVLVTSNILYCRTAAITQAKGGEATVASGVWPC